MAKEKTDRMRWPLPETDGPFDYIPVCIPIPNDPQHRQNFLGAILALSRWYNYEQTGDTRGKIAADAWVFSFDQVVATVNGVNPCCGDSGVVYRMNGDRLEQSTDGGTTWYSVPDGDTYWPPDDAPLLPPLPGPDSQTKACQAAWNAARVYQAFHITLAPYFVFGAIVALAISSVAAGFSFLIGAGPLGYAAISSIATAAIAIVGGGLVADDFDEEVTETLMCILVDHFGADGTMDEAEFTAMLADVSAEAGLIWDAIYIYIEGMGRAGMNNAARSQSVSDPDCSCEDNWCMTWDFTTDDHAWVGSSAVWGPGGWTHSGSSDNFKLTWWQPHPGTSFVGGELTLSGPMNGTSPQGFIQKLVGGTTTTLQVIPGSQTVYTFTGFAPVIADRISIGVDPYVNVASSQRANVKIIGIKLWGMGPNPYGVSNCTPPA
jgi:hypothetical protein